MTVWHKSPESTVSAIVTIISHHEIVPFWYGDIEIDRWCVWSYEYVVLN